MTDFNYPYTNRPEDLAAFFKKLPSIGSPKEALDAGFVKKVGLSTSSGKSLLPLLRSLGFTDEGDKATELWKSYAGSGKPESVMAAAIKKAYPDLFRFTLCPYLENDEEISALLKRGSDAPAKIVHEMLGTFRALCELADFQELLSCDAAGGAAGTESEAALPVRVNPNLQLTIQVHIDPQTSDDKIEAIFKNMRKYLLGKDG